MILFNGFGRHKSESSNWRFSIRNAKELVVSSFPVSCYVTKIGWNCYEIIQDVFFNICLKKIWRSQKHCPRVLVLKKNYINIYISQIFFFYEPDNLPMFLDILDREQKPITKINLFEYILRAS